MAYVHGVLHYGELFHLLFMEQLGGKLAKNLYALKGGGNLRFFLRSLRYSEDIDIDVQTIAKDTLGHKVQGILKSKPFQQILQVHQMEITDFTEPKQTETVQRWKVGLKIPGTSIPLRTKIEFSRRGLHEQTVLEAVDANLIRNYGLSPIMINHYPAGVAYLQKVEALISRPEPRARDVFDISLLLRTGGRAKLTARLARRLEDARANAMSITFEDFKGQVLAYLQPDYQAQYDSPAVWDDMVLEVVENLEGGDP